MTKELAAAGADPILLEAGSKGRLEDLYIHDWPYDLPRHGLDSQSRPRSILTALRATLNIVEHAYRLIAFARWEGVPFTGMPSACASLPTIFVNIR
jgi:hypothetical protein